MPGPRKPRNHVSPSLPCQDHAGHASDATAGTQGQTTTTEDTMSRFTLDETRAEWWVGDAIARTCGEREDQPGDSYLPDLSEDYEAMGDGDGNGSGETFNLVAAARDAGIITGPGELDFNSLESEEEIGYEWLLYLGKPGAHLKLASYYAKISSLGDRDAKGVDAALAVLREAVAEGNALLDDLDRYMAAQR